MPFVFDNRLKPKKIPFLNSHQYWRDRYIAGGTSGAGSYGRLAEFKAEIINDFVRKNAVCRVIEFGCGDGNQLSLAQYPEYVGLDISTEALKTCVAKFGHDSSKSFFSSDPEYSVDNLAVLKAELALSLDVVYHLTEDQSFVRYMDRLFASASRFVIIYSSDDETIVSNAPHVRHRAVSEWISNHIVGWQLLERIPNRYPFDPGRPKDSSFADFLIYGRRDS